jgi:hypothetical protein
MHPPVYGISHSFDDESLEAKARWWQGLTMEQRMELFSDMGDILVGLNPDILHSKDAQPIPGRVRVLTPPKG